MLILIWSKINSFYPNIFQILGLCQLLLVTVPYLLCVSALLFGIELYLKPLPANIVLHNYNCFSSELWVCRALNYATIRKAPRRLLPKILSPPIPAGRLGYTECCIFSRIVCVVHLSKGYRTLVPKKCVTLGP